MRYAAKCFWVLDVTDEWGQVVCYNLPHYLPIVLQIAPIDYVNHVTTCPYKHYIYIEIHLDQNCT